MYLLNILGLEYESKYVDTKAQEHKQPPYLQLNPNGRLPTLVDHKNNDYTVWCVSYEVYTLVPIVSLIRVAFQGVRRYLALPR